MYLNIGNYRNPLVYLALIFVLSLCQACSSGDSPVDPDPGGGGGQLENITLTMVDGNATAETQGLYSRLWSIESKGVMFGHHDDLLYGRNWKTEEGRSDIKDIVDDYPAVYSVDFGPIMDDRHDTDELNDDRRRTILEARARGQVILAVAHMDNPMTGGDSWDNTNGTVKEILDEGSDTNIKFRGWLDNLASFLKNLKDENGNLIPIIFRPYHEHNHTWSWWGKSAATKQEFIHLWQFTIEYLRDAKDVHNLIYAISPQLDAAGSESSLLERWPGDGYVDFIGMDSYNGTNEDALETNAKNLESLGKEKKKPVGVTETGIEGIQDYNGNPIDNYWTEHVMVPLIGHDISMVVTWRNKYDPTHQGYHYFAPFEGQSSVPDFNNFYDSSMSLFNSDLPDMYSVADGITIE